MWGSPNINQLGATKEIANHSGVRGGGRLIIVVSTVCGASLDDLSQVGESSLLRDSVGDGVESLMARLGLCVTEV